MGSPASLTNHRVVLHNVRWETYEALLRDRGDNPGPRYAYDDGELEIMSPSRIHESLKTIIGRLVETFTLELGIDIASVGSTTLKRQLKKKGLEPDESYYVKNEPFVRQRRNLNLKVDPPPDLAIEIDLTTSSVDKLGIYAALGVPEVWTHDEKGIAVYQLRKGGKYVLTRASIVLPTLKVPELNRFLENVGTMSETQIVKSFRDWVRASSR